MPSHFGDGIPPAAGTVKPLPSTPAHVISLA